MELIYQKEEVFTEVVLTIQNTFLIFSLAVIKATLNAEWHTFFLFPNLLHQGPMTFNFQVYDSDFNTVGTFSKLLGLLEKTKNVRGMVMVDFAIF